MDNQKLTEIIKKIISIHPKEKKRTLSSKDWKYYKNASAAEIITVIYREKINFFGFLRRQMKICIEENEYKLRLIKRLLRALKSAPKKLSDQILDFENSIDDPEKENDDGLLSNDKIMEIFDQAEPTMSEDEFMIAMGPLPEDLNLLPEARNSLDNMEEEAFGNSSNPERDLTLLGFGGTEMQNSLENEIVLSLNNRPEAQREILQENDVELSNANQIDPERIKDTMPEVEDQIPMMVLELSKSLDGQVPPQARPSNTVQGDADAENQVIPVSNVIPMRVSLSPIQLDPQVQANIDPPELMQQNQMLPDLENEIIVMPPPSSNQIQVPQIPPEVSIPTAESPRTRRPTNSEMIRQLERELNEMDPANDESLPIARQRRRRRGRVEQPQQDGVWKLNERRKKNPKKKIKPLTAPSDNVFALSKDFNRCLSFLPPYDPVVLTRVARANPAQRPVYYTGQRNQLDQEESEIQIQPEFQIQPKLQEYHPLVPENQVLHDSEPNLVRGSAVVGRGSVVVDRTLNAIDYVPSKDSNVPGFSSIENVLDAGDLTNHPFHEIHVAEPEKIDETLISKFDPVQGTSTANKKKPQPKTTSRAVETFLSPIQSPPAVNPQLTAASKLVAIGEIFKRGQEKLIKYLDKATKTTVETGLKDFQMMILFAALSKYAGETGKTAISFADIRDWIREKGGTQDNYLHVLEHLTGLISAGVLDIEGDAANKKHIKFVSFM